MKPRRDPEMSLRPKMKIKRFAVCTLVWNMMVFTDAWNR
jgi:hypothetical protein